MSKSHFKSAVSFSTPEVKVDRENGVVNGIVVVKQGANKNGTYFNRQFLTDLIMEGNAQMQGVKCRFGHPNMCATSFGTFLGRYKNFRVVEDKVFADLTLDPIAKKTQVEGKGISMWEYVLDMAENNPDMFGNSIVIASDTFEEKVGKKVFSSHVLHSFIASDLVDDPAATDSLFNSSNDMGVIVTGFLDANPQIFGVIQKDPSIIEDFFERYVGYLNNYKSNIDMSFLDMLKKKFGKEDTFDIEETTATGNIVKVITEGEEPKVGDKVVDEEGNPVADGDLLIKDGSTWVIQGGVISEIKEPENDGGEEEPTMQEVMNSVNGLASEFKIFKSSFQKSNKENQEAIELVADQVHDFDKRLTTLSKSVKSKDYDIPPAEPTGKDKKGELSLYERVQAKLNTKEENNGTKHS